MHVFEVVLPRAANDQLICIGNLGCHRLAIVARRVQHPSVPKSRAMSVTAFAIIEGSLLLFGALGSYRLTNRARAKVDRSVLLMAAVAIWFILFAMVPFLVFAAFYEGVEAPPGGVDAISSLVLNSIPFALVAAPLIGFTQGWMLSKQGR